MPAAYISHGGGPMPLLGKQPDLAQFLQEYPKRIPSPSAILVISAHWVTSHVSISAAPSHSLLFDYSGFPPETYSYRYDAPGSPALASRIETLLKEKNIPCSLDESRGWDHGVFVPLKLMYPDATLPVVAMSLVESLDPSYHIQIGRALASLREEGVLILGSGMSFHNFDYFFANTPKKRQEGEAHSRKFDQFLSEMFTGKSLSNKEINEKLVNWTQAPSALDCHPLGHEEHLIPLHVVFGSALGSAENESTFNCSHFPLQMNGLAYSSIEFA